MPNDNDSISEFQENVKLAKDVGEAARQIAQHTRNGVTAAKVLTEEGGTSGAVKGAAIGAGWATALGAGMALAGGPITLGVLGGMAAVGAVIGICGGAVRKGRP